MSDANVLELERTASVAFPEARVGWLVAGSTCEAPLVDFPGNPAGPVIARSVVAIDEATLSQAVETRRGAVLMFERGRADLPIIVGLLQPAVAEAEARAQVQPEPTVKVDADGKRLELSAHDEIVLRCGPASITLRRNGRVLIRGVVVETRASARNRIKGGTVQIN